MKSLLSSLLKNHWFQAAFYFLLGILFAFIFSKTVFSPTESVKENVPADPTTESRDI